MLKKKLSLPAAWDSKVLKDEEWVVQISQGQNDELVQAVSKLQSKGLDWEHSVLEDYELPRWTDEIAHIQQRLEGGLGFLLLRGLSIEGIDLETAKQMFWGIGLLLGYPEPQDASGKLMHHVKDTGKDLTLSDIRFYQTNLPLSFHNDGADVFMLMCYRSADRGGLSKIVSAVSVFNTILERRPELAEVLQKPFFFDTRGQQLPDTPPFQEVPVFIHYRNHLHVLYKREYIELAQRFPEVPELSKIQKEALDLMDEVCEELALSFVMENGDIVIANNYDMLHARTAFEDEASRPSMRHMIRLWLSLENGRSLPTEFAMTREFSHSYRRRLGLVL